MKIEGLKPWHIVLFVVALLGLIAGIVYSLRGDDRPNVSRQRILIDMTTGELFRMSTVDRTFIPPETNPKTKKLALMPVEESNGQWVIPGEYRRPENFSAVEGAITVWIDERAGVVKPSTSEILPLP